MSALPITDDQREILLQAIRDGVHVSPAARLAGLSPNSVKQWRDRGLGRHRRGATFETIELATQIEAALDQAEYDAVKELRDAGRGTTAGDWRASAWYLSHARPRRWSDRERVDYKREEELALEFVATAREMVNVQDEESGEPILSDEQREAIVEVARNRMGELAGEVE